MKKLSLSFLALITCTLYASESKLQIRHRESGGIGYNQGYSTVDYTISHIGELSQFLFNARGHLFNDARFASNLGMGARRSLYKGKYLLGGNFYYDFRESKHLLTSQVGGGLEFLSQCVDVRLNGYFPVGEDTRYKHDHFLKFEGNKIVERQKLIGALPTIDLEVGGPIKSWVYLGGGPYYLFSKEVRGHQLGNAAGAKVHCDIDVHRYVSLGGSISYDPIFHTKVQGYLALNIPLGKKKEKISERRLYDTPIYRNEIIPLHHKTRTIAYYREDEEGNPIRVFFVNNLATAGGNGSFEAPFASLKEAEARSGENDIIYVFKGDGTPRNMDEGIVLKEGQLLASSGANLELNDFVIPAMTPGEYPVLTNIHPFEPIVTNPGNTHMEDFFFLSPDQYYFWGHAWEGPWTIPIASHPQQPVAPSNLNQPAPLPPPIANNPPVVNHHHAGPPYDFSHTEVVVTMPDPAVEYGFTVIDNNNNNALENDWTVITPTPTPTPQPVSVSNSNTSSSWFSWGKKD